MSRVRIFKEKLMKTPYFHLVDPSELENIKEFTFWLEALLHNPCSIFNDKGELVILENRHLVERLCGLKIEVYSNEHPPPHFHVTSPNINASFSIGDCQLLKGDISNKDKAKVEFWHSHAKTLLIEAWNSTRPVNCAVGKYNSA